MHSPSHLLLLFVLVVGVVVLPPRHPPLAASATRPRIALDQQLLTLLRLARDDDIAAAAAKRQLLLFSHWTSVDIEVCCKGSGAEADGRAGGDRGRGDVGVALVVVQDPGSVQGVRGEVRGQGRVRGGFRAAAVWNRKDRRDRDCRRRIVE